MSTRAAGGRPARLLFVNQHYYPDVASTGQHLTDLCEHLAARGYDVGVLTSRTHYAQGEVDAPSAEVRNGVAITRLRSTKFGRGSHLGRVVDYASFYVRVLTRLLRAPSDARVVFLTTPPLVSFAGWLLRRVRGLRYGVWSMDLHPEAELEAGMLRPGAALTRALQWASDVGYRGADFVVDLGAYMKRRIVGKGVRAERTHTVHVWSSKEDIEPLRPEENALRRELGLAEKFVVMYSGNAGLVHDFTDVLEAMRRMRDDPRVFFLFVGGGPRRGEIESFASEHAITNFAYRPYFPRDQIRYSLTVADVHLTTLRAAFVGVAVPGKLYGAMASGRAALFVGPARCESADAVREARCGAVVDPADADAAGRIVETLRAWSADPAAVREMGERGRAAFLATYEREPNCDAWDRTLSAAWPTTAPAAPAPTPVPQAAEAAAAR